MELLKINQSNTNLSASELVARLREDWVTKCASIKLPRITTKVHDQLDLLNTLVTQNLDESQSSFLSLNIESPRKNSNDVAVCKKSPKGILKSFRKSIILKERYRNIQDSSNEDQTKERKSSKETLLSISSESSQSTTHSKKPSIDSLQYQINTNKRVTFAAGTKEASLTRKRPTRITVRKLKKMPIFDDYCEELNNPTQYTKPMPDPSMPTSYNQSEVNFRVRIPNVPGRKSKESLLNVNIGSPRPTQEDLPRLSLDSESSGRNCSPSKPVPGEYSPFTTNLLNELFAAGDSPFKPSKPAQPSKPSLFRTGFHSARNSESDSLEEFARRSNSIALTSIPQSISPLILPTSSYDDGSQLSERRQKGFIISQRGFLKPIITSH